MKITVIGTGYVSVVSGACLANVGNDVRLDLDVRKIRLLPGSGYASHVGCGSPATWASGRFDRSFASLQLVGQA